MKNSLKKFESFKVDTSLLMAKHGGGCATHCFDGYDLMLDCGVDEWDASEWMGNCLDAAC